jgi:hypothetical protein
VANEALKSWAGGQKFRLPRAHEPFMSGVQKGFSCANCRYLEDRDQKTCGEPNFVRWNGGPTIPGKLEESCSDWFEPA